MEKTKVIFIYGAPAVGKLTTAKILAEKTGYKVLHNHLTSDLVRAIFDRGDKRGDMLIVKFRFEMLEVVVKEKVNGVVMTAAYAHDFIYPNGESDEWFAKELERITKENGGTFYGVNLIAGRETLLDRVEKEDRLAWKKIADKAKLEETLNKYDFNKTAPLENNLIIENDNLSAEEVVKRIEDFITN